MIRQGTTSLLETEVFMPSSLEEAWELKVEYGESAAFIFGGTLLQTHWAKGLDCPATLISLENIKEMKGCEKELIQGQPFTRVGAATTLDFCRNNHELFHPMIVEAAKNIAAPAVRNRGTIGGNIASGFGDMIPALLVTESVLSLYDGNAVYQQSVMEYVKNKNQSLIIAVHVPEDQTKRSFYKKICHREAFTPSLVTVAGTFLLHENKEVSSVRLAVSGSATLPQRLNETERLLEDSHLTHALLEKAFSTIKEEFQPTTDSFSSSAYKKTVAANMIVSEIARLAR